jgi:hypothetical protein
MQIGPHESFADEASGICQYAKSKEDCIFFPCNTHGSALAENWVDREQITAKCEELGENEAKNYGLDQIALKYGSRKRLMKINGETLFAVSQIPNEEAPCEAHAAIRCLLCLAIAFVLDSASTIWVTNNVKNLLPSTVRRVSKRVKTDNGIFLIEVAGSAYIYLTETDRVIFVETIYVVGKVKIRTTDNARVFP